MGKYKVNRIFYIKEGSSIIAIYNLKKYNLTYLCKRMFMKYFKNKLPEKEYIKVKITIEEVK